MRKLVIRYGAHFFKLIIFIMAILLSNGNIALGAGDVRVEDMEYMYSCNYSEDLYRVSCVITQYLRKEKRVIIPSSNEGVPIVRIGESAFEDKDTVEEIIIPNPIMKIGKYAFKNCSSLNNIIIPKSVEEIDYTAFEGCSALQEIIIPNGLKICNEDGAEIGYFRNCDAHIVWSGMVEPYSAPEEYYYGSVNGYSPLYQNELYLMMTTTINGHISEWGASRYIGNKAVFAVPSKIWDINLTQIGQNAFYNLNDLEILLIPEGVTFKSNAFPNGEPEIIWIKRSDCNHENVQLLRENIIEPTCVNKGFCDVIVSCPDCGEIFKQETIITSDETEEHEYGDWIIIKQADCINEGLEHRICIHNENHVENRIIPAVGHRWNEWGQIRAASCTEVELLERECIICHEKEQKEGEKATGHRNTVVRDAIPEKCTEKGYSGDIYCLDCGMLLTKGTIISEKGHTWDKGVITKKETCTDVGIKTFTCITEGCSVKRTEELPALGHVVEVLNGKAATCIETGLTDGEKCSVCGEILTAQEDIPATGHTLVTVGSKAATCTETGLTDGEKCSVCDEVLKAQEELPAIGHVFGEWKVVKEATYDEEGMEQRVCSHDASHIETRAIVKLVKSAETELKPEETKPTQPETQSPTQTDTQTPAQPKTQAPVQPEVQSPTQTGTQTPAQPETQAPVQPETQTPAQPRPQTPSQSEVAVTPETEINEKAAPTASAQQKEILAQKNDNDPKGSTFGSLQAKAVKVTKSSIRVQWKKVKGATKYVIYGNKCGKRNRYKKLKTIKTTFYTQKKLKKGTYYKYLVVAIKGSKAIATSKTIHVATTGGKVGNSKSVKVNKKSFKISVGKKVTLKATAVAASKKLKVKKHRAIAFESSNKNIATVSKKGAIKGIRKGKCYIYAYAQNGVMAKVEVIVN